MKYRVLFCILSCVFLFGIMGCASQTKGDTRPAQPGAAKAETSTENPETAEAKNQTDDPKTLEATTLTNESEAETPTDIPKPGGHLYVRLDESTQEYMADDGTHLLTITKIFPVVTISGNEEAASAINDYVRGDGLFDENSLFGLSNEEALRWAESDYKAQGRWGAAYELCIGYNLRRMDDEVISFRVSASSYMGTVHPNHLSKGISFDTQTGKRLTLADIAEDEKTGWEAVLQFLLTETKKEEYAGVFYEDYEERLINLLMEDAWYLDEDGFHIIANEYEISCYAAGDFDFVMPYEQAYFLKEKYRK